MKDNARRAGFVAVLGAPNVGKSTLVNRLVGTKVSIVSPKVQTTRRRVIGITIRGDSQIMFVDTPGIFRPRGARRLEKAMVEAAWSAAGDADLVLAVIDARRGLDAASRNVFAGLARTSTPRFLVVNKIDLVRRRAELLPLVDEAARALEVEAVWLVSARTGDGCEDLLDAVAARMPEGPWLYPEDQLTDLSSRALAAEITREQVFLQLEQELPYSITVETEGWAESPDGREIRIDQTIYVMRDSQKAIVLGKGGQRIKAIGERARRELERLFDARVHLFLFVKVRERWQDDPERYSEMGLEFPG
ncbi:MAG TPA: GTPase Era [Rhodospirillales bacterium]|nr:GTPase Era [Rhodospirillales bacterium]